MRFSLIGFLKDWVVATSQIECQLQTHWGKIPSGIKFFGPSAEWSEFQFDLEVADVIQLATVYENTPFTALEDG